MVLAGGPMAVTILATVLMLLSVVDDLRGLSPFLRLIGHFVVALAFLVFEGQGISVWAVAIVAVGIVWMVNLYNFMDGADGIAGGMAVVGFASYAWLAWSSGDMVISYSAGAVAAAALAFLFFNFPPARIFLGDSGSVPLGFMAAGLGFVGWTRGLWPAWFPLVAFAMFITDATVTLVRRGLRGERVWQAHRDHYYQRLVLMGWSHRRLASYSYCLMLASAVLGIVAVTAQTRIQIALLAFVCLAHIALALVIDTRWNVNVKT